MPSHPSHEQLRLSSRSNKVSKIQRRLTRARSLSSLDRVSPRKSVRAQTALQRKSPWLCLFLFAVVVAVLAMILSSVFLVSAQRRKMPRPDTVTTEKMQAYFPIIIIPGILGSGLEIWKSEACVSNSFRTKIWGSAAAMITQAVIDPVCLFKHLSLNYTTGLDPEGIKVRASYGLEGADFLMGIYWIFAPLIEELASIGYDPNNMFMALYDWRVSAQNLEFRDHYFTKLKFIIEVAYKTSSNRKVVVCAHSYGALVFFQFLSWVQSSSGGRANAHWVETHIKSFINVAGPLLGVPKSLSSLISAEMKDTADLLAPLQYLKDKVWSRSMLVKLFRSWGSISDMLPKGGVPIWGDINSAPDDESNENSFGAMLRFTDSPPLSNEAAEDGCLGSAAGYSLGNVETLDSSVKRIAQKKKNLNVDESLDLLRKIAPNFMKKVDNTTSFGITDQNGDFQNRAKFWSNPLQTQLPAAPSMKIYCFYGVNKSTERSYSYQQRKGGSCSQVPFQIDMSGLGNGIVTSDGDGTVPLISLGFMCSRGWKQSRLNPSEIPVITKEYLHDPLDLFGGGDFRGGPTSGDHVDILGNHEFIEDILGIVSNSQRQPKQRIISQIEAIVNKVNVDL